MAACVNSSAPTPSSSSCAITTRRFSKQPGAEPLVKKPSVTAPRCTQPASERASVDSGVSAVDSSPANTTRDCFRRKHTHVYRTQETSPLAKKIPPESLAFRPGQTRVTAHQPNRGRLSSEGCVIKCVFTQNLFASENGRSAAVVVIM